MILLFISGSCTRSSRDNPREQCLASRTYRGEERRVWILIGLFHTKSNTKIKNKVSEGSSVFLYIAWGFFIEVVARRGNSFNG